MIFILEDIGSPFIVRKYFKKIIDEYYKYLAKSVAGNYSDDWRNPLAKWLVIPQLTDESGYLEFTGLMFAVQGNLGNLSATYIFQIRC